MLFVLLLNAFLFTYFCKVAMRCSFLGWVLTFKRVTSVCPVLYGAISRIIHVNQSIH